MQLLIIDQNHIDLSVSFGNIYISKQQPKQYTIPIKSTSNKLVSWDDDGYCFFGNIYKKFYNLLPGKILYRNKSTKDNFISDKFK